MAYFPFLPGETNPRLLPGSVWRIASITPRGFLLLEGLEGTWNPEAFVLGGELPTSGENTP